MEKIDKRIAALEAALEEERRMRMRLENALEAMGDAFAVYDDQDRLVYANTPLKNIYQRTADNIKPGHTFEQMLRFGVDRGEYAAALGREEEWIAERLAMRQRADRTFEQELVEGRWLKNTDRRTSDGGIVSLRVDITRTKQSELTVKRQNQYLEALHEMSLGIINRTDRDQLLEDILSRAAALVGTEHGFLHLYDQDRGELKIEISIGELTHGQGFTLKPGEGLSGKVWSRGTPLAVEDYSRWDGRSETGPFGQLRACLAVPLAGKLGVIGLGYVGQDQRRFGLMEIEMLTKFAAMASLALDNARLYTGLQMELERRDLTEQALRQSERRFRRLFDSAPLGAALVSRDGLVQLANRRLRAMLGRTESELANMSFFEAAHPEDIGKDRPLFDELAQGDRDFYNIEKRFLRGDGQEFWGNLWMTLIRDDLEAPHHIIAMMDDISDNKENEAARSSMEEELRHAQKMEAIGTLAGGVAHDFNNILNIVSGYTELALTCEDDAGERDDFLRQVLLATQRAKDLVKSILAFSRKTEPEFAPVDLNRLVARAVKLLETTLPKMIGIECDLGDHVSPISGDAGQLEQVILNLGSNARDAMPDGGTLRIETQKVNLDQKSCRPCEGLSPGEYALLSFSDKGCGIDDKHIDQIFDPFFTTKDVGKGTGLGLSAVYGTVKAHGGCLTCESEVNRGTTFNIYLPILQGEMEDGSPQLEAQAEVVQNCGTILVVDDEPLLLAIESKFLNKAGYQTLQADCGEAALNIFQERKNEIDLILLDVSMPGMGGHRCLERMMNIKPSVKVILASGYSKDGAILQHTQENKVEFLAKPYGRASLLSMVRKVLGS